MSVCSLDVYLFCGEMCGPLSVIELFICLLWSCENFLCHGCKFSLNCLIHKCFLPLAFFLLLHNIRLGRILCSRDFHIPDFLCLHLCYDLLANFLQFRSLVLLKFSLKGNFLSLFKCNTDISCDMKEDNEA